MERFERAFAGLEQAAASVVKAAASTTAVTKQLEKAVRTGDLLATKKALERLQTANRGLDREVSAVSSAWAFDSATEDAYLAGEYITELIEAAAKAGIALRQLGNELIAFPVVLRVLSRERLILLDGKKLSLLRPSVVVAQLIARRNRKPAMSSERFLEVLHSAYRTVSGREALGQPVALARIYEALTLLPGSASGYTEVEFARDLCVLDHEGPRRTKSGAVVSLPASTGTKDQRRVYSFVGPDGDAVHYFGIQFAENA